MPPTNPRGWDHQKRRAELLPGAYGTACPRCGKPMLRGQRLQLGHTTDLAIDPQAVGDRIEHGDCNERAGQALSTHQSKFKPSRKW